jgi:ABC-type antimicrobial peptide transport system permease subunit
MTGLFRDFQYALRQLKKNPAFSAVAIGTLALGIGASTAIFSVVYGVLLRSLPYYKPDRIVQIWEVNSSGSQMRFDDPNFEDMRDQTHSFECMAQMYSIEDAVSVGHEPDRINVAHVSKDFFSVMEVQPLIGRSFAPEERQFGAAATAVVSYSFWKSRLHEARDLSTAKILVSDIPVALIGVLPPEFAFPNSSQIWMSRENANPRLPSRSAHDWQVIARLRDGASVNQARADASAIAHRLFRKYGSEDMNMVDAAVLPLRDALTAAVKPALLVLLGVVGLLLLIACANVTNLSLAQASARGGELAIRSALGVSRWRLVRQFLAEALLLSFLASCLGIASASLGIRTLRALAPGNIPRVSEVSLNRPVLAFALALCVAVAASLGILTALRAASKDLRRVLAGSGQAQGSTAQSQKVGNAIAAGQIAITLTLLVGAGLLGRSMLRVLSVQPGFETEHVLTMDLKLPDVDASTQTQRAQFLDQLISRLRSLPGVQEVGGTNSLPLASPPDDGDFAIVNPQQFSPEQRNFIDRSSRITIEKADPAYLNEFSKVFSQLFHDPEHTGNADYAVASEGYFQSLGIPLLRGRLFNNADRPTAPHVAVISESVARLKWPNEDPIGQTVEFGNMDGDLRPITIVGVVGEVRMRNLESTPRPTIYVNYRQRPRATSDFSIVLRNSSDPAAIFAAARSVLTQLDPSVPPRFNTLDEIFSESLNSRRFTSLLVGVFAVTALLLALAGICGVLAYSVAQRTREIGVRMALGASTTKVLKMVLSRGLITSVAGVAMGFVGSLLLTRTMRSLLFEIEPNDPLTLVSVTLLLLLATMLATYIPARRAAKVDPMAALRYE